MVWVETGVDRCRMSTTLCVGARCQLTAQLATNASPDPVRGLYPSPPPERLVSKRTFQPNNRRRHKTHGFRLRMRTRAGRAILSNRRRKGRNRLAA